MTVVVVKVDELKKRARRLRPDLPTDPVIDFLVSHYKGPGTVYSPPAIAAWVKKAPKVIYDTLLLLAGEPLRILKGRWLFHDPISHDDIELSGEDVADAVASKKFFHPTSGSPVHSFRDAISLTYEAGDCGW